MKAKIHKCVVLHSTEKKFSILSIIPEFIHIPEVSLKLIHSKIFA